MQTNRCGPFRAGSLNAGHPGLRATSSRSPWTIGLPLVEPFAASVQARLEKKSLEDIQSGHAHDVQAQADLNRRRTALERAGTKRLLAEPA